MAKKSFERDPPEQFQHAMACLNISADFGTRRIWLFNGIDDETVYHFVVTLQTMDLTKGPIEVIMCSLGGSEPQGYAMFDAIRMTRNQVTIIGLGAVQSIAALIMQAADLRLLAPECRFMVHNGSVTMAPDIHADTIVAIGKEVMKNNHRYHQLLAERTGLPVSKIRRYCEVETYWSAEEAVKLNFADGVIVVRKPGENIKVEKTPKQRRK